MFASVTLINLCIIKENTKMKSIFEWVVKNALAMKKYW